MPARKIAAPTTSHTQSFRRIPRLLAAGAALALLFTAAGPAMPDPAAAATSFDSGNWWYRKLQITEAQKMAPSRGKGITVAVMDGTINPSVPELTGQKVITRKHGYCTADDHSRPATGAGNDSSHATAMAVLIAGNGRGTYGGRGAKGIAPNATVRSYVVGLYDDPQNEQRMHCDFGAVGSQGDAALAKSINQAVKDGADIISMSIGGFNGDDVIKAILHAERSGVILVAATDDSDNPPLPDRLEPPATYNGVIAVNAVDRKALLPKYSSYSEGVSAAAPGVDLTTGGWNGSRWSSATTYSGSSPATAVAAGSLALVWSHFPKATGNQILQVMVRNMGLKPVKGKHGKTNYDNGFRRPSGKLPWGQQKNGYGFGIINPVAMLGDNPSNYDDTSPILRNTAGISPSKRQITGEKEQPTATPTAPKTSSPSEEPAPATTEPTTAAKETGMSNDARTYVRVGGIAFAVVIGVLGVLFIRHARALQRKSP